MGNTMIAAREMGEDTASGRVGQGGERSIQCSWRIFNHLVKYLTAYLALARIFLQKITNRLRRCDDWPGGNCQKRAKEECFDRKLKMIFPSEEISREVEDRSLTVGCFASSANVSFDFDYSHEGA